jgi:hypothetical protein
MSGFAVQGDKLLVTGTPGDDVLTFTAGDMPVVTLNDQSYTVDPTQIHSIVFDGQGGNDQATLVDTTGFANELTIQPNSATMTGSNYALEVDNIASIIAYGSAASSAMLYGSANGANTFTGTANDCTLTGPDYALQEAVNFGYVFAYAGTTSDTATLYGSASEANQFDGSDMIGNDYQVQTIGFPQVTGYAGTSADSAFLYGDPSQTNTFTAAPGQATLQNSTVLDTAYGFSQVVGHAGTSSDTATLTGSSSEQNIFTAGASSATLAGADYSIEVDNFTHVSATAASNNDVAYLSAPNSGTNYFTVTQNNAYLTGSNYSLAAYGFATAVGYAGTASDTAYFYGPATPDGNSRLFVGSPQYSALMSNGSQPGVISYSDQAVYFQHVYATGDSVATTEADLYGATTGGNTFTYTPTSSHLTGTGYSIEVDFVALVIAQGNQTSDYAYLYGSTSVKNVFQADPGAANGQNLDYMRSGSSAVTTIGFRDVFAYGHAGDEADFYNFTSNRSDVSGFAGNTYQMDATGTKYFNSAQGFGLVEAHAGTASDNLILYGANYGQNAFYASQGFAALYGPNFTVTGTDYHYVYYYAGTSSDVAYLHGSNPTSHLPSYAYVYGSDYLFEALNLSTVYFNYP